MVRKHLRREADASRAIARRLPDRRVRDLGRRDADRDDRNRAGRDHRHLASATVAHDDRDGEDDDEQRCVARLRV